jgi:diguanylate cyclase (GGDEF)-like protein
MHLAVSLCLNTVLILAYGIGIIFSYRLAANTMDRTARRVRFLTAVINAGMLLLSVALFFLIAGNDSDLTRLRPPWPYLIYFVDFAILVNIIAVFAQLSNVHVKIWSLTEVYRELKLLRKEATIDPLTGLLNRRVLTKAMDKPGWDNWCFILIDIDDFKIYNDKHGHLQGDQLLRSVGDCVRDNIRSRDYAFRFGGEEIAVLCPHATIAEGQRIADRLCVSIRQLSGVIGNVTASVGIGFSGEEGDMLQSIAQADIALYEAKRQGKNRVVVFEPKAV